MGGAPGFFIFTKRIPAPDDDAIASWIFDGESEATDGCMVEPDGICPHGHPSWLLRMGII